MVRTYTWVLVHTYGVYMYMGYLYVLYIGCVPVLRTYLSSYFECSDWYFFLVEFYSEDSNVALNATKFVALVPTSTPPGSHLLTLGFIVLETATIYDHSFLQTDGFDVPVSLNPKTGQIKSYDYLKEGRYNLSFLLLVQPLELLRGTIEVEVVSSLGESQCDLHWQLVFCMHNIWSVQVK